MRRAVRPTARRSVSLLDVLAALIIVMLVGGLLGVGAVAGLRSADLRATEASVDATLAAQQAHASAHLTYTQDPAALRDAGGLPPDIELVGGEETPGEGQVGVAVESDPPVADDATAAVAVAVRSGQCIARVAHAATAGAQRQTVELSDDPCTADDALQAWADGPDS